MRLDKGTREEIRDFSSLVETQGHLTVTVGQAEDENEQGWRSTSGSSGFSQSELARAREEEATVRKVHRATACLLHWKVRQSPALTLTLTLIPTLVAMLHSLRCGYSALVISGTSSGASFLLTCSTSLSSGTTIRQ